MYTQKFGAQFTISPHFLELLNSAGPKYGLPMKMVPVSRTGVKGIEKVLEWIELALTVTAELEKRSRHLTWDQILRLGQGLYQMA